MLFQKIFTICNFINNSTTYFIFYIFSSNIEIAQVTEDYTDRLNYYLKFPLELDVNGKALILAAAIYIVS